MGRQAVNGVPECGFCHLEIEPFSVVPPAGIRHPVRPGNQYRAHHAGRVRRRTCRLYQVVSFDDQSPGEAAREEISALVPDRASTSSNRAPTIAVATPRR